MTQDPLFEMLKPHVSALEADASSGDQKAQAVIQLYDMVRSCPEDPAARAFCEVIFKEWQDA